MMRRARLQVKPNLSKSARSQTAKKEVATEDAPPSETEATPETSHQAIEAEKSQEVAVAQEAAVPVEQEHVHVVESATGSNNDNESTDIPEAAPPPPPVPQPQTEYTDLKSVFAVPSLPSEVGNVPAKAHHVHFEDGVDMREEQISMREGLAMNIPPNILKSSNEQVSPLTSPTIHYYPQTKPTPRSRNVSLCEDEAKLHSKTMKERKRFSGKEEIDTKTWKMSDLALYNPRHEKAIFKRERKTSGSSYVTKSECTDNTTASTPVVNAPQVKIGADGRLVIDESSLVAQSAMINHESVWETVEEGRNGSKVTSMSFRNRIFRKSTVWTVKETNLFYEVLRCTGSDFGLMHHYMPQRTRFELKAKYNREEKINWARVSSVLSQPACLDESLGDRVAKLTEEMEREVREKKEQIEYKKSEERRMKQEVRDQKTMEKEEEVQRRNEVRKMLNIAREKARMAREMGRVEREQDKVARSAAKEQAKIAQEASRKQATEAKKAAADAAAEAKIAAYQARMVIKEARDQERQNMLKNERMQKQINKGTVDSLEREAERIIRRLIYTERREKHRQLMLKRQAKVDASEASSSGNGPDADGQDQDKETEASKDGEEGEKESEEMSAELSSSSSSSESDEEALHAKARKRETQRMNSERRSLEPRKTKLINKPVYVPVDGVKYAQEKVDTIVEMAQTQGNMFDSADEEDDCIADEPAQTNKEDAAAVSAVVPTQEPETEDAASNAVEVQKEKSAEDVSGKEMEAAEKEKEGEKRVGEEGEEDEPPKKQMRLEEVETLEAAKKSDEVVIEVEKAVEKEKEVPPPPTSESPLPSPSAAPSSSAAEPEPAPQREAPIRRRIARQIFKREIPKPVPKRKK